MKLTLKYYYHALPTIDPPGPALYKLTGPALYKHRPCLVGLFILMI